MSSETGGGAVVDWNEGHLLGRQGQFLGRWWGHDAGGFGGDVVEGRGFDLHRLLLLCAVRALHTLGWRRQAVGAFLRGGGSLSCWSTLGANGVLDDKSLLLRFFAFTRGHKLTPRIE